MQSTGVLDQARGVWIQRTEEGEELTFMGAGIFHSHKHIVFEKKRTHIGRILG